MHGFTAQVKPAPHLKLMNEWTEEDVPSFLSVKKMSQVELRNAVGAESLPNPGGSWIPGPLSQKLSRQLHLPV